MDELSAAATGSWGSVKLQRGSLVELDLKECARLDTPKPERPWLVIQANHIKDSLDVMVCPLTGTLDVKGKPKKQLSSYALLESREIRSIKNAPWRKDSYVKCGKICTVLNDGDVDYVGFLSPETMVKVDQVLRLCLALPLRIRKKVQVEEPEKPSKPPSYSLARAMRRKNKA